MSPRILRSNIQTGVRKVGMHSEWARFDRENYSKPGETFRFGHRQNTKCLGDSAHAHRGK